MATKDIKRKDAARLLETIAHLVALAKETGDSTRLAQEMAEQLAAQGFELPRRCNGEAHSNPHVDNCSVCMPNWGWVSQTIKVK